MKTAIQELIKDLESELKKLNRKYTDEYMERGGIETALDLCEHYMTKEKEQIEKAFEEGMFHHTNGLTPKEYYEETHNNAIL
jgi:hypothetical protein